MTVQFCFLKEFSLCKRCIGISVVIKGKDRNCRVANIIFKTSSRELLFDRITIFGV